MIGLEIIFTLSALALLFMWGWFIILAFRTSKLWGVGLIAFFPLSPFMFAYRFERKTRRIIYYYLLSFVCFAVVNGWIFFATIDFFDIFSHKLGRLVPSIETSTKPKVNPLLPKPTPIPEPVTIVVNPTPEEIETARYTVVKHGYETISISNAQNYKNKKVRITTDIVVHQGKLISVGSGKMVIKKELSGGSTIMSIPQSNIKKIEVYL